MQQTSRKHVQHLHWTIKRMHHVFALMKFALAQWLNFINNKYARLIFMLFNWHLFLLQFIQLPFMHAFYFKRKKYLQMDPLNNFYINYSASVNGSPFETNNKHKDTVCEQQHYNQEATDFRANGWIPISIFSILSKSEYSLQWHGSVGKLLKHVRDILWRLSFVLFFKKWNSTFQTFFVVIIHNFVGYL